MESAAVTDADKKADEARRAHVRKLCNAVQDDIKHWKYAFERMKAWRDFARGLQWPGTNKADLSDPDRDYTANITMRHLKQRVASIYAKNPTYQWRRTKRMTSTLWDGTMEQIQFANQMLQAGLDLTGQYQAILMDASRSVADNNLTRKQGETLSALYEYFVREQTPPAKSMMKKQVLVSKTCGVAYFKQTFQRATDFPPETNRAIADHLEKLARLERLSADLADDEIDKYDAEMSELREGLKSLEGQQKIILREGLAIDYPDSTNIIPDCNMTHIVGFVGCNRVTEQYCLTPDQIREVYGKNVGKNFVAYRENDIEPATSQTGSNDDKDRVTARVWEIWDRAENLVYTVCDGYEDFLEEPHAPITYTERFYPWFVYAPNAVDDPDDPFPPSDVELMMPMQMEINRAGEALRQHRYAARPGWVSGVNLPDNDRQKIENRSAHSLVVLSSLTPEDDVRAKFQPFPVSPIDPNLYTTGPAFEDILRSVGTQEANLGGTSGATATESSIAEGSRQSVLSSDVDEFDDLLTEMARAGGQILLQQMSAQKVKEIVGPGAIWPEVTPEETAKEIHLEVVAGSSGRPNQAQEVAMMERTFPLLFQLPGISHEKLSRHGVKVLDDGANFEDWMDTNAIPIMALTGQMQAQANAQAGAGQGAEGGSNAERPAQPGPTGPTGPGQDGMGMPQSPGGPAEM